MPETCQHCLGPKGTPPEGSPVRPCRCDESPPRRGFHTRESGAYLYLFEDGESLGRVPVTPIHDFINALNATQYA